MNRRERRGMEKKLGLRKHYKKQTRDEKFQRWRENLENGRRMEGDMKTLVEEQKHMSYEDRLNQSIEREAMRIAEEKKIPVIDAMIEAQEIVEKKLKR
jgi:hypothetical protein